jgi:RND family efflux transporter MFP subunit
VKARLAVVALALLAAACSQPPAEDATNYRATVTTRPAARGRIERTLVGTGTVRAESAATLVTEASGKLSIGRNPRTHRRWAIGDEVRTGDLLGTIAPAELSTQARLEARRAALRAAEADQERHAKLHEQGLLSDLEMAQQDTKLADARAELRAAELQESKSQLHAPIGGVITSITNAPDGEFIGERQEVAQVMEFGDLIVDLDLGSAEILDVARDQSVRVVVPGSDVSAEGRVARLAPAIDPKTRTFRVEVVLPKPDPRIRPGMFVRAEIVLEAHDQALLVPTAAVVVRRGVPVVFVVEAQRASQHAVKLGLSSDESAEVLEGVSDGQPVVVTGQDTLDDGVKVVVRD